MENLKQLLIDIYNESDDKKRKEIEPKLNNLSSNISQMISSLLEIIQSNEMSIKSTCAKSSAAIYLKQLIKINVVNNTIKESDFHNLVLVILNTCMHPEVDILIVDFLAMIFEVLLKKVSSNNLENFENFIQFIIQKCNEISNHIQTSHNICSEFAIFNYLCSGLIEIESPLSSGLLLNMHEISILLCQRSLNELEKIQTKVIQGEITLENQKSMILDLLKILFGYSRFLASSLELQRTSKFKFYENFVNSSSLAKYMVKCIKFKLHFGVKTNCNFISNSGLIDLDNIFNYFKLKVSTSINYLLNFIDKKCESIKIRDTPFFDVCKEILPFYTQELYELINNQNIDFDQITEAGMIGNIVVQMLKTLTTIVCNSKDFFEFLSQNKFLILIHLVFVLLRTTSKEIQLIETDAKQFVNFVSDTCDKQQSEVCKTEAAKLLEEFCEHIDGSTSFVSLFVIESIDFYLDGNKKIDEYEIIKQFQNSFFFMKSSPEIIVDTCLLVMIIISYLIPKRNDLLKNFQMIIYKYAEKLIKESSILIQCKIALMLGYYMDILFEKDEDHFHLFMHFLIDCLSFTKSKKALAIQACDSLKNIMKDPDSAFRIESSIGDYFDKFWKLIEKTKMNEVFSLVMIIVRNYSEILPQREIISLLKTLTARIPKEYELCKKQNRKNNIKITLCWNLIRAISENECFYPSLINDIEDCIIPLFEFMLKPEDIEFDDDIVLVATTLIQKRKSVSIPFEKLFGLLHLTYNKYKGFIRSILNLLNAYLEFGQEFFINNININKNTNSLNLKLMIDMSLESLFSKEPPIESNNADAAILIQLIIQFIQPSNTQIYIPIIIESVIKRLEENPISNCLNIQLLNTIFSCICSDTENSILLLEKQNYVIKFFDRIRQKIDPLKIKSNYDKKIMILGLSTLLMSVPLFTNNQGVYSNLLILTLKILQSIQSLETKKLSKNDSKQIDFHFQNRILDEEKSNNAGHINFHFNQTEVNTNLKKLQKMKKKALKELSLDENDPKNLDLLYDTINNISTKINKIDEFLFFSSCLKYAEQSGIKLTLCFDSLGEKMTSFLYQIINFKRIEIENSDIKIKSVRKIVCAKRMLAKSEINPPTFINPVSKKPKKGNNNLMINNKQ